MDATKKIYRNDSAIYQKIDKEFIVIDVTLGKLYKLNNTAESIWKYLSKPRTLKDVVQKISAEYSVSESEAKKEVSSFIKKHINALFYTEENLP